MENLPVPESTTSERYWVPSGKNTGNPKWDEENIRKLKKYYCEGLSASKIAVKLGFATRNAIISKLHSLGITGRKYTRKPRLPRTEIEPKKFQAPALKHQPLQARKHRYREPLLEVLPLTVLSESDLATPHKQRCSIMGLTADTCRWPIGEPCSPDFFYCGGHALAPLPYCAGHARLAYRRGPVA